MLHWIDSNQTLAGWLLAVSVVLFIGGLLLMPILLARMPPDHFLRAEPHAWNWSGRYPALRLVVLVVKNLVGLVLLVAGLAMFVLPGPGIITILVGVSLLNFPGKRALELRIMRRGPVLRAVNWMRAKAKQSPLILPDGHASGGADP